MLNNRKNGLEVFDSFQTDYKLPKHNKKKGSYLDSNSISIADGDFDIGEIGRTPISGVFGGSGSFISVEEIIANDLANKSILNRLKALFKKEKKPTMSIADFFKAVKGSAINIEKYTQRSNDYLNALKYAKQLNQDALVQELKSKVDEAKYESILYSAGFTTVITEEQVVKFYKECKKGLALTWVRNYIRIIPEKASEKKKEADALEVFDNYVILFYDPNKKAYKEEKDPILFGVIKGVRKLYYIADWMDEYCDLTLEQFIDKFGEEAIKANDITVNYTLKK